MAARTPTLHELCYPGTPYIPRTHTSPPKPTSAPSRLTMMELCYPEVQYVPRTTLPSSSDFNSECWNILDPSSDHSDTISESHLFDTDPTPKSLDSPNPTIFPHVDNRSTLERCLAEILRADELEQSTFSTSSQPMDPIQITNFEPTDCTDDIQI